MNTVRPVGRAVPVHALAVLVLACIVIQTVGDLQDGTPLLLELPFTVLLVVTLGVGWLLTVRMPGHAVGRLLLAIPALFLLPVPLALLEMALGRSAPDVRLWLIWFTGTDAVSATSWAWLPPVWILLTQVPLRFPDGRLPSPRWRWFWRFTVLAGVLTAGLIATAPVNVATGMPNPVHIPAVDNNPVAYIVAFGSLAVACVVSIASLIVRYRRSSPLERVQLRWVLFAVAVAVVGLAGARAIPSGWSGYDGATTSILLLYALIPIAIAVAVLRYRLYEIDRIISRTAAYAVVTAIVVGTYAIIVLATSALLPHAPSVGVAVATLAAAAVFLPALRWIRRGIDRVFNRAAYDAARVLEAFSARIRNGVDPHRAASDLTLAIEQALQPGAIGIWTIGQRR